MTPANRRSRAPWSVEDTGAAFVVKDKSGQKLGYFYYEEEPGRSVARRGAADRGQLGQTARAVKCEIVEPHREEKP
jgi:hypothetical protein